MRDKSTRGSPEIVQFYHRNLSIFMQKIIYRDCTQISLSVLIDFTIISLHPQCSRQILGSSANNLEGKREEGKRGRRALTESGKRGRGEDSEVGVEGEVGEDGDLLLLRGSSSTDGDLLLLRGGSSTDGDLLLLRGVSSTDGSSTGVRGAA
jgi:hypothetical protein